jgi:hypothetical protein
MPCPLPNDAWPACFWEAVNLNSDCSNLNIPWTLAQASLIIAGAF